MDRRQSVIDALEHRTTNPIPYHIDFTQQALNNLIAYTGDPGIEQKLGTYLNYIQYWGWPTKMPVSVQCLWISRTIFVVR